MPWIKHTDVGKSFLQRASISPRGLVSLSDPVVRKYADKKPEYSVLYYEPESKLVGIEFADEPTEGAIKVRYRPTGAYIAAASFLGRFDLAITATTMYDVTKDLESGFLVLDLTQGKVRNSAKEQDEDEGDE